MIQHSFGIIPLRNKGQWEVFLVQHHAGHWSFPKGKLEEGETPHEAAGRELFEETGLSVVKFLPFEELNEHYIFTFEKKIINKEVTYFMAEVAGQEKLQPAEISQGRWFSLSDAAKMITFKEAHKICVKVQHLLS